MAEIVLGIGTSHSPHLSTAFEQWDLHVDRDHHNRHLHFRGQVYTYDELVEARKDEGIEARELGYARWRVKHEACERAIATLGETLAEVAPDVVVIVGDDQREMFLDDGMPAIAVFWGATVERIPRAPGRGHPSIQAAAWANSGLTRETYACVPSLGEHIIRQSMTEGFDVAQLTRQPEGRGIGHAFNFVRTRLMQDNVMPMVPITLNTYPPNQPTPGRCYAFGKTLRQAIESWDSDLRVAIVASGGLSHFAIDEELDRRVIDGLAERDEESLSTIPLDELESGSSEIRNWITVGGAMDHLQMELIDYVPIHRTPAGTGCGMTFARWQ
jgi:3-O-methylgallate 3,4-dioxygenase